MEGLYFTIIKAIYNKATDNIIPKGKKLKAFSLRSGTRQRSPLSPLLFYTVLDLLAEQLVQKEERKGVQIGKKKQNLVLFAYIYTLKTPPKNC